MRPLTAWKCVSSECEEASSTLSFKSPGHQSHVPDTETDEPFAPLTPAQSNSLRCHVKNRISSAKDDLS